MSAALVIGVDIGGTRISAGLVDDSGSLRSLDAVATPARAGRAAVVAAVVEQVERLRVCAGSCPVVAVGIGSAGVVDPTTGAIASATDHINGWAGTPLSALVRERTGLPCTVLNDVHAHGLGEARSGAGRGVRSVLVVAAGTGLGGAFVVGGEALVGAHGAAGHLGHTPSSWAAGMSCACGGSGHLECVASGAGLAQLARSSGLPVLDAADLVRQARSGDPGAQEIVDRSASALGEAIGGWVNVLDPDVVVLTGGLSRAGDTWWDRVRASAEESMLPLLRDIRIVPGLLDGAAAVVGAACAARAS